MEWPLKFSGDMLSGVAIKLSESKWLLLEKQCAESVQGLRVSTGFTPAFYSVCASPECALLRQQAFVMQNDKTAAQKKILQQLGTDLLLLK
jgi:hypothetical protein